MYASARCDVTEVREQIRAFQAATTSSFNAMREDLSDLRRAMNDRFARVDNGFTKMRGTLDGTAAAQRQIVALLNTLIGQSDP